MKHPLVLLYLPLLIYVCPGRAENPDFPLLFKTATNFETLVEVTDLETNTTAFAQEYYSQFDGRLDFISNGKRKSFYYGILPRAVFVVDDTSCVKTGIESLEFGSFREWVHDGRYHLYLGPLGLQLLFERDDTILAGYRGTREVRNITTHYFEGYKSEIYPNNLTLKWYFAVEKWMMPSQKGLLIPVRIELSKYTEKEVVNQRADFIYFRPNVVQKSKLQIPVGLGCLDRSLNIFPDLPRTYSFSAEGFDLLNDMKNVSTEINLYRVWYNEKKKVARLDSYTSGGRVSEFHDFKTGVTYHMNIDKTCTYKRMKKSLFLDYDSGSLVGRMKSPAEVLNLKGQFYNIGDSSLRGISCRIYEKAERNVTFYDKSYSRFVTTVYFVKTSSYSNPDIPMEILITGYGPNNEITMKKQFQIFSFTNETGKDLYESFPIETCFPASNQKSYFLIGMEESPKIVEEIKNLDSAFQALAKSKIITVANITEIRLPFLKIEYTAAGILISGLILERPPFLAQFNMEMQDIQTEKTASYLPSSDAEDAESCAKACIALKSKECKGFHFCGNSCYLNTGEITNEDNGTLPINSTCDVYIRAVKDSENSQDSLDTALKNLVAKKENGKFKFNITVTETNQTVVLEATEVVINLNTRGGDDVNDYPYTLVKAGVQLTEGLSTTFPITYATSEEDCYRQCKESTFISCASFSYCGQASNKMCRISSVVLEENSIGKQTTANPSCDAFSLLYLDYFYPYPGKTLAARGERTFTEVQSPEECAKNCREVTGLTCRGFEYCKGKNTCELHSKHVLDLGPGETVTAESQCVHYAAKFIADYRDKGNSIIRDQDNVRRAITLEECARACSEEIRNCNSINYCRPTAEGMVDSSCSFTSKILNENVGTTTQEKCRLYTKRNKVEDWTISRPDGFGGYTKGGFAGLLAGMLILGLVIGAVLFVTYKYIRSRNRNEERQQIQYSRK